MFAVLYIHAERLFLDLLRACLKSSACVSDSLDKLET
jgi:hypothetical protein